MTNITDKKKELERLSKLADYDIDYSKDFDELDDLSKLAAHISGTPISLINLIGANTQWSISNFGMDMNQISRSDSVCDYTINEKDYLELTDLDASSEFKDKPYVAGDPNLKYYFGIPLKTDDGINIGAVCVMDKENHSFSPEKIEMFKLVADEVMRRLDQRKLIKDLKERLDDANEVTRKVSHDIRGPISGIIGLSSIIIQNEEEYDISSVIELAELINQGGKSVLDLADEILSAPKSTVESEIFKNEFLTLKILKEKLLNLYKPQAQLKGINFKVTIDSENKGLSFSKTKMLQIFGNMISNAIKFTENNGTVNVALNFSDIKSHTATLVFSVEDNGVGMTDNQIDTMLNHQAASTKGTNNERGFGFGFQLSKNLIESMNGSLEVHSKVDSGSEIIVSIPVKLL